MRTTCCLAEWTPPARMRVLTGVRYCARAHDAARGRRRDESSRAAAGPSASAPTSPASARAAAERGDVVGRVAGAAGHHLRRVVLEDQHRRLARDARDLAVDELVGDEVADDEHAAAREAVDEREQALLALGLAGLRRDGRSGHITAAEFRKSQKENRELKIGISFDFRQLLSRARRAVLQKRDECV